MVHFFLYLDLRLHLTGVLESHVSAGDWHLTRAVASALKFELLIPIPAKLAAIAFTFCQPLLMQRLLDFLQGSEDESTKNLDYGLVGAYLLVYLGIAASTKFLHVVSNADILLRQISTAAYGYRLSGFLTMGRGTLVAAICKKITHK